jgi:hypothetical protein
VKYLPYQIVNNKDMKRFTATFFVLFILCTIENDLCAHIDNANSKSIGLSIGASFSGPLSQMSKYLETKGYGITSSGFIFGSTNYPVKTGPRSYISLVYAWKVKNEREIEIELNVASLGEIAGLNGSGERIEVGFQSYTLGSNYRFGPRLTKMSIGPTLMFNRSYAIGLEDFNESRDLITTTVALGLKTKLLLYLWNKRNTYGNIGGVYVLSYATEHGPFPTDENRELEKINLNFGYGAIFFSLGLKF